MGLFIKEIKKFLSDESGATMVEYALMAGLIAAVCVAAATGIGTAVQSTFTEISGAL